MHTILKPAIQVLTRPPFRSISTLVFKVHAYGGVESHKKKSAPFVQGRIPDNVAVNFSPVKDFE